MSEQPLPNALAKTILVGWLKGDLTERTTGSGKKVMNANVWCGKYYGSHRVTFWEDDVQRVKDMGANAHVYVEARLQRTSWEKDGATIWEDQMTCTEVRLLAAGEPEETPAF